MAVARCVTTGAIERLSAKKKDFYRGMRVWTDYISANANILQK